MNNKIKVVIMYMLILIVFVLIGYLIYFIVNSNKEDKTTTETPIVDEGFTISDSCNLSLTLNEYNSLMSGVNTFCTGYSKFTIKDASINNGNLDLYVIFNNDNELSENEGIFLNNKKIYSVSNNNSLNSIYVYDDIIYIKNISKNDSNVLVYNSIGTQIYDLSSNLINLSINDSVLGKILSTSDIDSNSYIFNSGGFTFNSSIGKCNKEQNYSGNNYKINYVSGNFSIPQVVDYVSCQ